MALQGTLDTFALADLVRLLATTSKTGELAIDGDRGTGRLWFADGQLVGGEPAADDLADAVFALLRMQEGDFAFEADSGPDEPREPCSALDVLAAAEARLEEWRPVEELVPSPAVALSLRADLDADEVTISRDLWRRLVAVAGGATAGAFGEALGLDEHATGFAIRDLVDAGLIEVGDEVLADEADDVLADEADDVLADDVLADELDGAEAAVETPDLETPAVVAGGPEPAAEGAEPVVAEPAVETEVFGPVEVAPVPAEVAEVVESAHTAVEDELANPAEPVAVPPVLGVVPDPPYSFGSWGDGPVPAPDDEVDPAVLGPWEPLTPVADVDPEVEDAATPEPEAASDESLPTLDAPAAAPDLGSYAVDLDSQLGGAPADHSYLGTADDVSPLPEPLLGAEGIPGSDAAAVSAPPEPPEPAVGPEPGTGAADELAARRERALDDRWAGADASADLGVPLDSLSPAAARALAAAASADDGTDDNDAGRRVLRRIISTGKG